MNKTEAISVLKKNYPDLRVYSIVEDPDMFIAQMVAKNGESIIGGTKGVLKGSGKTIEVSPLRHKGLIERLMAKSSLVVYPRVNNKKR